MEFFIPVFLVTWNCNFFGNRSFQVMEDTLTPVRLKSWQRLLPKTTSDVLGSEFLSFLELRGMSSNTIVAYGRSIESFIAIFGSTSTLVFNTLVVQRFLAELKSTKSNHPAAGGAYLSRATIAQRVVALRSFADYLVDRGLLRQNPVPIGAVRRTPEGEVIGVRRGLLSVPKRYPRVPTDNEWMRLLIALQGYKLRDQLMFAMAYDGALRRNEIVTLALADLDFSARQIRIRQENSKNGRERVVPYCETTSSLLRMYLAKRRSQRPATPSLFVSDSPRNFGKGLTGYTWGLVCSSLKKDTRLDFFTTHTLRHLRLTGLARAGMDLKEISQFAGHRSIDSTMTYIHLSGRDLARAFDRVSRNLVNRLSALSEK